MCGGMAGASGAVAGPGCQEELGCVSLQQHHLQWDGNQGQGKKNC